MDNNCVGCADNFNHLRSKYHNSPIAVPGIFVGFEKPSSSADRGYSLRSLIPPPGGAPIAPNSPFSILN